MITTSSGKRILTGRAAAEARNAKRRAEIDLQNDLARAVRLIADQAGPVAHLFAKPGAGS